MANNGKFNFPENEFSEAIFGLNASKYGYFINSIISDIIKEEYKFNDIDHKEENTDIYAISKEYWIEILFRSHMAAVISIIRTNRLAQSVCREFSEKNLLSFSSSCRSMIESCADINYSLYNVPIFLAEHSYDINNIISKKSFNSRLFLSEDLENKLIHFLNASKHPKNYSIESHKAKLASEYIGFLNKMIPNISNIYDELCKFSHPSAYTVYNFLSSSDKESGKITINGDKEDYYIIKWIKDNRDNMEKVLSLCYNAPVLIIKVLHRFNIFNKVRKLNKLDLTPIKAFRDIDIILRR